MPTTTTRDMSFRLMAKVVAVFAVALLAIAAKPAAKPSPGIPKERYLSPLEMASSPSGHLLYVVCQESDEVRIVDVQSGKVIHSIPVGRMPRGIALSPNGQHLYITNAWSDTVSVIDTSSLQVVQTIPTGPEPSGVVSDSSGSTLYVANRLSGDVSVIDLKSGEEIKRLLAGRGA
ncbi:MAG: beta-propeller fold lactonase family protein, partial [Candidatus Sulfotelmatobacter sp.]